MIRHGIRLNAVDIGWTPTPGERRWFSEEEQNRLSRSIPIGRAAQADECHLSTGEAIRLIEEFGVENTGRSG